jgi:hypothetical protein
VKATAFRYNDTRMDEGGGVMSEELKIALTVLGGLVVFVTGQIVVKFIIEPIHDQKKLIGEIAGTIIFYCNVGAGMEQHYYDQIKAINKSDDPMKGILIDRYKDLINAHWGKSDEASKVLRQQATELLGKTHAIPLYRLWAFLRRVPKLDDVIEASTQLIGMSNSTHSDSSFDSRIEEIVRRLGIRTVAKQRGISEKKPKMIRATASK